MPGIFRLTLDLMLKEIEACLTLGIKAFDVFPVVEDKHKDKEATQSINENFFYIKALREIKSQFHLLKFLNQCFYKRISINFERGNLFTLRNKKRKK